MRINRTPLHVMVLLPSGRRHMVPRAATNLERPEGAASPVAPLPVISVRTILPLAHLVQRLGAWPRRKAMPSKQRQPSIPQHPVSPVSATSFHQLPPSHQQQLAHLMAGLIRRVRTAAQTKQGNHERWVVASHADHRTAGQAGLCLPSPILAHASHAPHREHRTPVLVGRTSCQIGMAKYSAWRSLTRIWAHQEPTLLHVGASRD